VKLDDADDTNIDADDETGDKFSLHLIRDNKVYSSMRYLLVHCIQ